MVYLVMRGNRDTGDYQMVSAFQSKTEAIKSCVRLQNSPGKKEHHFYLVSPLEMKKN